jgi:hypothetical protein
VTYNVTEKFIAGKYDVKEEEFGTVIEILSK